MNNMAYNETPTKGPAMLDRIFKKFEVRTRVVRTDSSEETTEAQVVLFEDPEAFARIAKDVVKYTTFAIGGILIASTILHTISELIIKSADQNKDDE